MTDGPLIRVQSVSLERRWHAALLPQVECSLDTEIQIKEGKGAAKPSAANYSDERKIFHARRAHPRLETIAQLHFVARVPQNTNY